MFSHAHVCDMEARCRKTIAYQHGGCAVCLHVCAALVSAEDLEQECILPSVREAATAVAASVASVAIANRNSSVSIDSTRCLAALEKADVVPTAAGKQVQRPVDGGQSKALDCVKRLMYTA